MYAEFERREKIGTVENGETDKDEEGKVTSCRTVQP